MQGKVHAFIGVGAATLAIIKYPTGMPIMDATIYTELALLTVAAGSYFPDIDLERTHMGHKHPFWSKFCSKFLGGHRGGTHSLTLLAAFLCGVYQLHIYLQENTLDNVLMSLLVGFSFGWFLHIVADLFNGKGCQLFWPIPGKLHFFDLPSSGAAPWFFAGTVLAIAAFFIFGGSNLWTLSSLIK